MCATGDHAAQDEQSWLAGGTARAAEPLEQDAEEAASNADDDGTLMPSPVLPPGAEHAKAVIGRTWADGHLYGRTARPPTPSRAASTSWRPTSLGAIHTAF